MTGLMRRRRAPGPTVSSGTIPAPIGGLNTVDAGPSMPGSDAVQLYNMVAAEYGLRTRLGYREWVTGLTGSGNNEVRTILPFTGSAKAGTKDRLFAVTNTGIWDVTSSTSTPGAKKITFGTTTGDAGYGVGTVFVNSAGAHFLLFCDEVNGYHVYTESTDTWAAVAAGAGATQINGATPANLSHVTVWANRVWFTERDTGHAWYTDVGALYGTVTKFVFGSRFRAGGDLRGLFNWTRNGSTGAINALVGISGGGDVVIYEGTDPSSSASFGLKGVWSLGGGGVPYGRRIATDYGGELLLLTTLGVLPLSAIVNGENALDHNIYSTHKISNLFAQYAYSGRSLKGWQMRVHPQDNTLMINVPIADGSTFQFVMSLATKGWSRYRDLPTMLSAEAWQGDLYFGTTDGKVCKNTDFLDGVTLAAPTAYTPIQWEVQTAFSNLGSQRQKRAQALRLQFITQGGSPGVAADTRFDYDFTELGAVATNPGNGTSTWGTGLWGTATWGGDYTPATVVVGASGMGVAASVIVRGTATSRTSLVGVDVVYDAGGIL